MVKNTLMFNIKQIENAYAQHLNKKINLNQHIIFAFKIK